MVYGHDDRFGDDRQYNDTSHRYVGRFRADYADRHAPYSDRRGGNRQRVGQPVAGSGDRVFVSNLSFETSWQDLKDHFKQAGDVGFAKVLSGRDGGRSSGNGIVEMNSAADARKAMDLLDGSELDGRQIGVREYKDDGRRGGGDFEDRRSGGPIRNRRTESDSFWDHDRREGRGRRDRGGGDSRWAGPGARREGRTDRVEQNSEKLDEDLDAYFAARSDAKKKCDPTKVSKVADDVDKDLDEADV